MQVLPVYCITFFLYFTEWKDIVEVGAINCAVDANMPLCQDHNVEGYPTIKVCV